MQPLPTAPLALSSDEIHLWLVHDREIQDAALLARYHGLLSAEERAQEQRFHFAKDRHQYLLTRALTRSVLSFYAPVAARDWRFEKETHGRPRLLNVNAQAADLVFNLSHSAGLIVLAVTRARQLGVDTENIAERSPPLEISRRYFSPSEAEALFQLPQAQQAEQFFHYWTLKEAWIKARSKGLADSLAAFSFQFPDEHSLDIHFSAELEEQANRWHFWLLRPTADHLLAVCTERRIDAPGCAVPRICLRRIVPLAAASAASSVAPWLLRQGPAS